MQARYRRRRWIWARKTTGGAMTCGAIAAIVGLAVIMGLAPKARASCSGGESTAQMLECMAEDYAGLDRQLNTLYRDLRARLQQADQADPPSGRAASLQQAQRQWITMRDGDCLLLRRSAQGGSIAPLLEQECLTRLTLDRIGQLEQILAAYQPH